MPYGMWLIYRKSFRKHLSSVLGYDEKKSGTIMRSAGKKYREIIDQMPEFERADRFKMNAVNCALFISFLSCMDRKPSLETATRFYTKAMMTPVTKWFCRMSGKNKFTPQDIQDMKETAAFRAADRNPYSWNMEYIPYEDGSGYEARFTKCGICTLMKQYGFYDLTPAMCRLDYDMSEAGGASVFTREHTIASGWEYCDNGYKKRQRDAGQCRDKEQTNKAVI